MNSNPNFQYLDNLPQLPEELIEQVYYSMEVNPSTFHDYGYDKFKFFQGTKKLHDFTSSIFDFHHNVNILAIRDGFYIHTDVNRNIAYNYIIEPGGSAVSTNFHYPEEQRMESYLIRPNRWHRLRVDVLHNITNIEPDKTRIVLSVWQPVLPSSQKIRKRNPMAPQAGLEPT